MQKFATIATILTSFMLAGAGYAIKKDAMVQVNLDGYPLGLVQPDNWKELGDWDRDVKEVVKVADLPKAFNWRDYYKLSPVKNQGSCGSCMTFSVNGVVEGLHRIAYPMLYDPATFGGDNRLDLSEQTLVSTCSSNGDCSGGYFGHFNYVRDKGLPFEKDDKYQARNSRCKAVRSEVKIDRWAYVGSRGSTPSVEELKAALYEYGPLSITINGSIRYSGGVYTSCGATTQNHAVTLEGWVDDPKYKAYGGGYWIVRNSWGKRWGENGFIRIAYRRKGTNTPCHGVAQVAGYAVLPGMESIRKHIGDER